MKQLFCIGGETSNQVPTNSTNAVLCLAERNTTWDFNDDGGRYNVAPANGTIGILGYYVQSGPGAGEFFKLYVDVNDVDSTDFALIEDVDTYDSQTFVTVVVAGNKLNVKATESDTSIARKCSWSLGWEGTTSGQAIMGHLSCRPLADVAPLTGTWHYSPIGSSLTTVHSTAALYAPFAGTIKSFYILIDKSNLFDGSGSMTFSIYKNGAEEASAQVVFDETDNSGNVTGLSVAISAGDTITYTATAAGTITDVKKGTLMMSVMYEPATDGESWIGGGTETAISSASTLYFAMNQVEGTTTGDTVEVDRQVISGGDFSLKDFRVNLGTAPGVGKSRTFRVRKDGVNTDIVVTISDASTSGVDSTNTATFAEGSLFSISETPSGTPANSTMRWSAIMYDVDYASLPTILARPMYLD